MSGADVLLPVREMASGAIEALGNGRPTGPERVGALFGAGRGIVQATANSVFASRSRTKALSAVLSMINPGDTPPNRFASCLIELEDHGIRLRMDRDVIDAEPGDRWSHDATFVGDALARNLRLVKHAPWQLTDDPDGDDPSEIICDDGSSLTNAFRLMKDVLAASGITQPGASLKVVLPTATMPALIEPIGFATDGITALARTVTPLLSPSLQIWRRASGGTIRVSRVHTRASAEDASPMESLRATDRLIALLGADRMHGVILR